MSLSLSSVPVGMVHCDCPRERALEEQNWAYGPDPPVPRGARASGQRPPWIMNASLVPYFHHARIHIPKVVGVFRRLLSLEGKSPHHADQQTGLSSWDGVGWLSLQRIRTPLTPEILKSSMSWTMVSLLGSLGSLSRTWSNSQGAIGGSNLPLTHCSPQQSLVPSGLPTSAPVGPTGRKVTSPSLACSCRSSHSGLAIWSLPLWEPCPAPWSPSRPCTHIARPWAAPGELRAGRGGASHISGA